MVIVGSVIRVAIWWLQGETSDGSRCKTNVRVDRGLCRVDARVVFVSIRRAYLVIR